MYGFCNGPAFSSGEGKFEGFSRFSMFFRSFEHQDRFPIVFSQTKCVWGPLRKCTDPYESIPSAFPCEIMRFPHFPNRFSKISVINSITICSDPEISKFSACGGLQTCFSCVFKICIQIWGYAEIRTKTLVSIISIFAFGH